MGTDAYKGLSAAEQAFKNLIWMPMMLAGENWLETAVPIFRVPVIKEVEEETVKLVLDYAFEQIRTFLDIGAIKLVNLQHQAAFDKASLTLKIIAHDHGINSPEFEKGLADEEAKFSAFVHFGAA